MNSRTLKKSLALILSVVMMLSCMVFSSVSASATDYSTWTAISSQADLLKIEDDMSGNYYLTCDITISGSFSPIGWTGSTCTSSSGMENFYGTFDGCGYTISGLTQSYTTSWYVGLFASNGGTIKNLIIDDFDILGLQGVGTVAGVNGGTISNVQVTNSEVNGYVTGTGSSTYSYYIGGIVGQSTSSGIITYCTVSNISLEGTYYVGGAVGCNFGTISYCNVEDVYIMNNYTTANIQAAAGKDSTIYSYYGGLVGRNQGTISYSSVTGQITIHANTYAGGLVGQNYYVSGYAAKVTNSYVFYDQGGFDITYLSNASYTIGGSNNGASSSNVTYSAISGGHTCTAGDWVVLTEATETTTGYQVKYCSTCYAIVDSEIIPATGTGDSSTDTDDDTTGTDDDTTGTDDDTTGTDDDTTGTDDDTTGTDDDTTGTEDDTTGTEDDTTGTDDDTTGTEDDTTGTDDDTTGTEDDTTDTEDDETSEGADYTWYGDSSEGDNNANVDVSYSQDKTDTYKVTVEWGSLEFTYTDDTLTWNTDTMTWDADDSETGWSCDEGENQITVTNSSSKAVNVAFDVEAEYAITVTVDDDSFELADATGGAAVSQTVTVTPDGFDDAIATDEAIVIATVTVVLTAA